MKQYSLNKQYLLDSFIPKAESAANTKVPDEPGKYQNKEEYRTKWNFAYHTAMDWFLYPRGLRDLNKRERNEAEEMYGEFLW